jgi:hypothetical protein
MLSMNPADYAIDLLIDNPDKIDWRYFSANPNPRAYEFLQKHPDKINYSYLSANPNAVEWLKYNPQYIDWWFLSRNENAIDILEENMDKIIWHELSYNSNAIRLFNFPTNSYGRSPENSFSSTLRSDEKMKYAKHEDIMKFNNSYIKNPQIFVYDYEKMIKRIACFKEELMQRVWCPTNVLKWGEQGYDDFLES